MNVETYNRLYEQVITSDYKDEVEWQENLTPCVEPIDFLFEYMWVVVSAGMKNQIARQIMDRIHEAINNRIPIAEVFGHKGKVEAINWMMVFYKTVFPNYQQADDKLTYLESLPWIGPITKYHLAKNLGYDCVKPDRHLVRISKSYDTTPDALCRTLSDETGQRISTVDLVIWRAANLGWI